MMPDCELEALEAHVSQRINELQTLPELDTGWPGETSIAKFEPFSDFDYCPLPPAIINYNSEFKPGSDSYQRSAEIVESLHNLSDTVTESVLNLHVRLNEMQEKFQELQEEHNQEWHKLRGLLNEAKHGSPSNSSRQQGVEPKPDVSQSPTIEDLKQQIHNLKERLDQSVVELVRKLDERQTGFMNVLDTRVKVMEKLSISYKESLNHNFFNLAVLLIVVLITACIINSNNIDHSISYLSHQIDGLHVQWQELIESKNPPPQ